MAQVVCTLTSRDSVTRRAFLGGDTIHVYINNVTFRIIMFCIYIYMYVYTLRMYVFTRSMHGSASSLRSALNARFYCELAACVILCPLLSCHTCVFVPTISL